MNVIYDFLSANMNTIILVLGIGVFVVMIYNSVSLKGFYKQLDSILNWNVVTSSLNRRTQEMEDRTDHDKAKPETVRVFQKEFNRACALHEVLAQLIPIFPLFGILGTVSGLILQLVSNDVSEVFGSLHIALSSTFWGLVFAIILKAYDSIFPARRINQTEILLEDYDKKLNTAVMLGNITE